MKRNNCLMIAYIIFIFVCVVVRFFEEFPRWQVLVVAITATSWVFSLADFNYTTANELHAISKNTLTFIESNIDNIQVILNKIDLSENASELSKIMQEKINNYKTSAQNCIGSFEKLKVEAEKSKHIANLSEKMASIFIIVGFVGFFSILSFDELSKMFTNSQDIMTVMAFGLILFTQYMGEISKENREKQKEASDAIRNRWERLRRNFELEVSNNAH